MRRPLVQVLMNVDESGAPADCLVRRFWVPGKRQSHAAGSQQTATLVHLAEWLETRGPAARF